MKTKQIFSLILASTMLMACGGGSDEPSPTSSNGGNAGSGSTEPLTAQLPTKTNKMKVFAHYMPWFETPATNMDTGKWGWHWTMNTSLNPNNGEIAAHYHPLTGPYASGDANMLDYQCLLMKYAGIDGVIADWYGSNADNTTARHTSNTEALLKAIAKAGMELSICYEDQTVANASDPVGAARTDMSYLNKNFFNSNHYTKVNGKPLLLCFGPQGISTPKDWFRVFQILSNKPEFIVLNYASNKTNNSDYTNSQGEFLWVNPNPTSWYITAKNSFSFVMGGAMPGFWDYYREGNAGDGYTTYDAQNGVLFNEQLYAAKAAGLEWLQISTWNDYGEGTIIEPTIEFGYRYLTALQSFTGVSYNEETLKSIYTWYTLKVKHTGDASKTQTLNKCYDYFNALQPDKAIELMNTIK